MRAQGDLRLTLILTNRSAKLNLKPHWIIYLPALIKIKTGYYIGLKLYALLTAQFKGGVVKEQGGAVAKEGVSAAADAVKVVVAAKAAAGAADNMVSVP